MNKLRLIPALAALTAMAAGCSSNPSNGIPKISSVNPLSTGKLGFAVGTANIYGGSAKAYTGLNVVSTYRQSSGVSNVLVDTPTITGPFALPAYQPAGNSPVGDPYSTLPAGPSVEEVAAKDITGTSQSIHIGTPACDSLSPCSISGATIAPNTSTFGQAGGVFTDGLSPGNSNNVGVATSYQPYPEPLYDADATGNVFVPFGGPPAFPGASGLGTRDGLSSLGTGVLGFPLGISTFEGVTPSTGTYTLSLQVPTGFSGAQETYGTAATTATLSSTALLGNITAPVFTPDNNGGGSFVITALPAGVTEELVQIVDSGIAADTATTCQGPLGATADTNNGGAGPVYYTIKVTAPGTYTLPDTIGPNTAISGGVGGITPSESLCTATANTAAAGGTATAADSYTVQAIGADYPLYESLYPNTTAQLPTLTGTNGQADITISAVAPGTAPTDVRSRPFARIRRI